ncbi:MAG: hypothetical protein ACK5WS_06130 [Alphaproteobacteria bacterium]|jgi:hypothetical protein|nr:hypothetical protein [Candidatus Jidaibacter sp.]
MQGKSYEDIVRHIFSGNLKKDYARYYISMAQPNLTEQERIKIQELCSNLVYKNSEVEKEAYDSVIAILKSELLFAPNGLQMNFNQHPNIISMVDGDDNT